MGIYLEAPRDDLAARNHAVILEIGENATAKVLKAAEGTCVDEEIGFSFASQGFTTCSALILHSSLTERFGLFHVYPGQEVDDEHQSSQVVSLRRLAGASGILIEGSASTPKKRILADLHRWYAVDVVRTITVDTIPANPIDNLDKFTPFHVVFRPASNEILVARISHRDILRYKAFQI